MAKKVLLFPGDGSVGLGFDQLGLDDGGAEGVEVGVGLDEVGSVGSVAGEDVVGGAGGVDDYGVGGRAEVADDGGGVVGCAVAVGLAGLGHDVADVDLPRGGAADGAGDARDEEVGDDAGVEAARAEDDEVGGLDCVGGLGEGFDVGAAEEDFADGGLSGASDFDFSADGGAVGEGGAQVDVGEGGGEDSAFDGEDAPDFVLNRIAMQNAYMDEIWRSFSDVRAIVPLFEREVRGVQMLKRTADYLFA